MSECALWYMRHGSPRYELCESEQQAALRMLDLSEEDYGAPMGVQFPDGRTIQVEDWQAWRALEDELYQQAHEAARWYQPPVRTREIRDPFDGHRLKVDAANAPEWLGARP